LRDEGKTLSSAPWHSFMLFFSRRLDQGKWSFVRDAKCLFGIVLALWKIFRRFVLQTLYWYQLHWFCAC